MSIIDSNIKLDQINRKINIRMPAVSGLFYPDNKSELAKTLQDCFNGTESIQKTQPPKAIIAPHAGYIYSGPTAAHAYASLVQGRKKIKRVILLGPAHRVALQGIATTSSDRFRTPLGDIDIDHEVCQTLLKLPQVQVFDKAFDDEHSLEVHLPFLQSVLETFTLVPLVVGKTDHKKVSEVLQQAWGGDDTLIVISSDLSHYHDYETAKTRDKNTCEAIQNLAMEKIGPQQACGCYSVNGLIHLARDLNLTIKLLDMSNSGDTAGPRDRVVGYSAFRVDPSREYTRKQEDIMLQLARESIKQGLESGKPGKFNLNERDVLLNINRACFVTLHLDGKLRGCIGTTETMSPLLNNISNYAYRAAFHDPRFHPLTDEEFKNVLLSISILSESTSMIFESESDLLQQIRPGLDGLIIENGSKRATFLPEVWNSLPKADIFLRQLKQKAGFTNDEIVKRAWRYSSYHVEESSN